MTMSRRTFVKSGVAYGSLLVSGVGFGCASGPRNGGGAQASSAPPRPQKILVLGGTGFLGPHVVDAARARGHTLTLFNRGKTNPHLFPDVEKLQGNRDGDLKSLEGRKWDSVVDTSGYVPRIVKASADLLAPNVQQYVFISTISVYNDDKMQPGGDETSPLEVAEDPKSEEVRKYYGALKALCEQAAEASMPGRVINIRPGLIVGPGDPTDRFTYWPVRVARGGDVLAPGDGNDPVQFIDARDLATWIVRTIERRDTGVYNATGPARKLTMAELLDACKKATGGNGRFQWVDAQFLEKEKVSAWSDMPVWIPRTRGRLSQISIARALGKGLNFRGVEETARDTLAWWRTQPEERRARLRAGIKPDREEAVLAAWTKVKSEKQKRPAG